MRRFTDVEIIGRIEGLRSFAGWRPGVYDVWVRSKADRFDEFDDRVFTYEVRALGLRPAFVMACTGTTNPGSYGLKNFRLWNRDGCAVLASDILVYDSHGYGLHKGRPAYVQLKNYPYYRDKNGDQRSEEVAPLRSGVIGANCHAAGTPKSTRILNWSVGCLVRNDRQQYDNWLKFLILRGKPKLSVVILKEF